MDARSLAWDKLRELAHKRNMLIAPREYEIAVALREDGVMLSPTTIRTYISHWIAEGKLSRVAHGAVGIPNKED